ncbi:vegetative incompatibility protein HET-E-1 [Podospora australis]|uniref:Vegetative incompatibility protein HET-E-1 n=1 Tax=Podospora australis TaxID=1536484 RepID=A0AAN6WXD9_9PEZI|nr:vegetative incompatibility protein HET-E-1 [Podospora australis]
MKLINVTTREVEEFFTDIPTYAILSHTWGPDEVSYVDMESLSQWRKAPPPQQILQPLSAPPPPPPPPPPLFASALSSALSSHPALSDGPTHNLLTRAKNADKSDAMRLMLLANMLMAFRGQPNRFARATPLALGSSYPSLTGELTGFEVGFPSTKQIREIEEEIRSTTTSPAATPAATPMASPTASVAEERHATELKAGYTKIQFACDQAAKDGYQYVWVDTCCIDKRNSGELTEALNSMFNYYQKAAVCYAFLEDVQSGNFSAGYRTWEHDFVACRWFKRGWTLQELLAPKRLVFYAKGWKLLGTKSSLVKKVAQITKIDELTLLEPRLVHSASIAQRMSWASARSCTRVEDTAYCMLGLFGINLPIIYGEGENAFLRLQEEIIRRSDDHSIFAWGALGKEDDTTQRPSSAGDVNPDDLDFDELSGTTGVLARSPADFAGMDRVVCAAPSTQDIADHTLTNKGLRIQLNVVRTTKFGLVGQKHFMGVLNCHLEGDASSRIGLLLTESTSPNVLLRTRTRKPTIVSSKDLAQAKPKTMYIPNISGAASPATFKAAEEILFLKFPDLVPPGYEVIDIRAKHAQWNKEYSTMRVSSIDARVLYQLCVVTFWNRHLKCGFVVRVIVDGGSKAVWMELCQEEPRQTDDDEEKNDLLEIAKMKWENPGRVEVSVPNGKKTAMVEIVNPVQYEEEEEADWDDEDAPGRKREKHGQMISPRAVLKLHQHVTFVETWEQPYMRTVEGKCSRTKKGVVELGLSSMLWQAAETGGEDDLHQPS